MRARPEAGLVAGPSPFASVGPARWWLLRPITPKRARQRPRGRRCHRPSRLPAGPTTGKLGAMADVTQILRDIEQGGPSAAEQLLPLVCGELRRLAAHRLAHEQPGQTLQATALVHEVYLRLVDVEQAQRWNSRGHFFAAAAEA